MEYDTEEEFCDSVENKATVATVSVIHLCKQICGDTLQIEVLSRVDVVHARSKISGYTLLSLLNVACEDVVDWNVYRNGAVLTLAVVNDGIYNSSVRCDKRIEGLCATRSRDTDFVDDIQYAGARLRFVRIGDYCSSKNLKEDIADS